MAKRNHNSLVLSDLPTRMKQRDHGHSMCTLVCSLSQVRFLHRPVILLARGWLFPVTGHHSAGQSGDSDIQKSLLLPSTGPYPMGQSSPTGLCPSLRNQLKTETEAGTTRLGCTYSCVQKTTPRTSRTFEQETTTK